jgi:hypothetical protein
MVYKIAEIKYTSCYQVVMQFVQKGKRYVHRAIFYLNKVQVSQDLKDGFLTVLLINCLLMLILYFLFTFFPFYINFLKTPSK